MKRNDDFLIRNAGSENFLVPLRFKVKSSNGIVILNGTGSYVWTLLQQEMTMDDLVDAVVGRFVVERKHAYTDIQSFLDELARLGLLE